MKTCFKCRRQLPIVEFYAHPMMADGRLGKCKSCTKKDTADRVAKKKNDPHWVEVEMDRCRLKTRRQRADGIVAPVSPEDRAAWLLRNPEKHAAHVAVRTALRSGRLLRKPCEICGDKIAEAHHDDYSKPLCVRWLCDRHHKACHVEKRRLERAAKLLSAPAPNRECTEPVRWP